MTDTPEIDLLTEMLASQEILQRETYGHSPTELLPDNTAGAVEFITWNVLALTDELHELLGETSWKPWAKSEHVNLTAARSELIDAFHFFMNLALVLGMDADSIYAGYNRKRAKNIARQEAGYDGVTTKCPGCKRALDDDGVACEEMDADGPEGVRAFYCAEQMTIIYTGAPSA